MTLVEYLILARLVLHLATVLLLASYCHRGARFRLGPSIMAGMLLSSSAGMATHILLEWPTLVLSGPQPQLLVFVLSVFIPVAWARGNVARIYDGLSNFAPSWKGWFKL